MEFRHIKLILRWLWLLILIPILSVGISYLLLREQATIYEARAVLVIGPGIDSPNPDLDALRAGAQLMQTYAELPRTDAFQERIISNLNLTMTTAELNDIITIRPIVDTQLLHVIVQFTNPDLAMNVANAVAQELVNLGPSNEQNDFLFERISEQAHSIEENIIVFENRIDENTTQLAIEADSVNRTLLIQQIADDELRLSESNNTLADLYAVLQQPLTNRISIIDTADDALPLASETALTLIVAVVAGLILSALIAIGLILLEDRTIGYENLANFDTLPLWGLLKTSKLKGRLPVKLAPDSTEAQQYYQLGAQVLYRRDADSVHSILFTSLNRADFVPELVSNLALAIANTQNPVFLLDVDFRHNAISKVFDLDNATQLSDLFQKDLVSEINLADVNDSPYLKVLPSGDATTEHSFSILASPKMLSILRLLKQASNKHRLLMMAAPPLEQMHDSLSLVSQVDSVVLVINNHKVTKAQLEEAIEKLQRVGAKVCGMIIMHGRGTSR